MVNDVESKAVVFLELLRDADAALGFTGPARGDCGMGMKHRVELGAKAGNAILSAGDK